MVGSLRRRLARAGGWLAWAGRAPLRAKPAQLRAYLRLGRSGSFDPDLYLARNPDVRAGGMDPLLHYVEFGAREGRNPGSSRNEVPVEVAMKRDWDARARADAMHFAVSGRLDWEERSFSESGRLSVENTIRADLDRICGGRDPAEMRVLEIGCGNGRMTEHLAGIFGEVHGVDASAEMISRARARLGPRRNVFLYETNGLNLAPFDDGFFDFAFSFLVFQHVPTQDVLRSYAREVHRTLKPGSIFKFQVRGHPMTSDAWADTWKGVSFDAVELRRLADETGFSVRTSRGEGTQYLWSWWMRET